jgi:MFS transporter, Spinster family, sphingosine-1-phosphate transporter
MRAVEQRTPEEVLAEQAPPADGPDLARAARPGLRAYGLRPLMVLFILNTIDEFDRAVLAVALEDIRDHFSLTDAQVGILPLAVIFITGILALPVGNLADRWTRTKIMAVGAVVWGSAGLLAAVSRSFVQLFLTRAMLGAGQGTIGPTHLSLLSDYYPPQVRGRVLNYWRSANAFGQIIGAVGGGLIIAWVGWRWGFVAAAIPGLIFGLVALSLREPKRGESDLQAAVDGNPMIAEFLREPTDKKGFFESLSTILRIPTLRNLVMANAVIGFTLFGAVVWFPALFERHYGFSTEQAGLAFGALALAAFFGIWYGGPLADRLLPRGFGYLGRLGVLAVIVLLTTWSLGFAAPHPAIGLPLLVGGSFIAALGSGGLIPIVAACAPPRIRSQAFATFNLSFAVCGAAAAPVVIGGLSQVLQDYAGMSPGDGLRFAMLIATATVTVLGAWLVYRASRTADADAGRTIAEFIADHTREEPPQPQPPAQL